MVPTAATTETNMIPVKEVAPKTDGNAENVSKRVGDNKRSNKPIMEKRRRARINNCLNELKTLILDAMKKDPTRHSKLEKADILEMTVKHLRNLQRQQSAMLAAIDPAIADKFRAGFSECASEVGKFPGLEAIVKRRLLQHLANCLNQSSRPQEVPQVQVHIVHNKQNLVEQQVPQSTSTVLSTRTSIGVQVLPAKLPNGDIAFLVPNGASLQQQSTEVISQMPLLIPIVPDIAPSPTSVQSSSYSPVGSPEPMEAICEQIKPLALIVRKHNAEEPPDEKPWRPW